MSNRDDLDVLRFLAVSSVVLYHIGVPQAQNGFIGVDVFFILSGFLVMQSILRDKKQGSYSLNKFLQRRARRLVPALLLVLLMNIPIMFLIFSPQDIKQVFISYLSILIMMPNVYFWNQSGYFDIEAKLQAFLHTWSLGIEIQFYIVIGLLTFILFRYSKEKFMLAILVSLSVASLTLCTLLAFWKPGVNFYMLPSRIWEFTVGSLIAVYMAKNMSNKLEPRIQRRLKFLGASIVVICLYSPIKISTWPSFLTILPIFGSALVLIFNGKIREKSTRFHGTLAYFGKTSYGWFLWHWPVIVYANYFSDNQISTSALACLALLTLFIAIIQFHFFENRFRDRNLVPWPKFQRVFFLSSLLVGIIAISGVITNGFDSIWRQSRTVTIDERLLDKYLSREIESQIETFNSDCKFSLRSTVELNEELFKDCANKFGPATIVIGDSHGVILFDIIARSELPLFVIGLASPGSRPSNGISGQYLDVRKFLENNNAHVARVLFMQSGSYLMEDRFGEVDSNFLFRKEEFARVSKENILVTLDYLSQLSNFVKVMWIGPYTQSRINVNNPINWYTTKSISPHVVQKFTNLDSYLFETLKQSNVSYISSIDHFKVRKNRLLLGSCVVWRDEDHFSVCGRKLLARDEVEFLSKIFGET